MSKDVKLVLVSEDSNQEVAENICPRCSSIETCKSGKHYNKKYVSQRYQCKICGTTFTKGGYFKHKFPLSVIQYTIALYQSGLSLENCVKKIWSELSLYVSRQTLLNWLVKANVPRRPKWRESNPTQKNVSSIREHVQIGITTLVRFSSSYVPEKILVICEDFTVEEGLEKIPMLSHSSGSINIKRGEKVVGN